MTNPAHIPPPGYLQFEQGLLQANTTPGGVDHQFSLMQTTKLSLNHHIMPFLISQPYARSVQARQASNDAGDLDLGVQFVLLDEGEGHGSKPTLAVAYAERVRAGSSADLDTGSYRRSITLLASGNGPLGLHYDTNALFNEQVDASDGQMPHSIRRLQFGQTLSVTHGLTKKLAYTGEIWRFSQPFTHGNAIGNLNTLGYTVRKTLVLDGGFSRGLTGTSTHWETFAGFTYLLPHRLWPLRSGG